MQTNDIAFEDIFKVDPVSGRISLATGRYIMLDAAALADLRREITDNLGWEVAKGVFLRMGYRCGRYEARQMHRRYPQASDQEWLRKGFDLYRLRGMVTANIDRIEIDREQGKLYMSGEWLDSFEAELQLQHTGIGSRTACWMLEGYAAGYASELFGAEVICSETHCRGKGDSCCRFELRPASELGKTAKPIMEMLTAVRFMERFDRCLRIISDMGCELEQTSLDGVITTDAQGIITSCSQGASEMLGIPPSEAIGKKAGSFCAGGESEMRSIMQRLLQQGRLRNYLTEFVTPSGRVTPIMLSASAIRSRSGEVTGTIVVAHDLSEIRRLEDELAKKNRFMANILRDSADAIITMDPNGIVTSWNKGAESIFGYRADEMIGKSIEVIVPPELREARELEWISRRFQAQGAVRSHQTERITKDGRRIQVIFTRTAIRDDSGNIIGSSSVVKDVTSFRNLERQLAEAEHLASLGEMCARLAHEIKNPLAGIKGAIDVIRDSLPHADGHRRILGEVIREVNQIDKIVSDLLNYAKPKPPVYTTVDLPEVVNRMVEIARASHKYAALPIKLKQNRSIPLFTADETQLEQIILNLLLNAQNAVASGGHIEVILDYDAESGNVRLEVRDDGPGIPPELQKKIFQPFFTTRTDGVGLGLATCLKNIQHHGGTIEVHSGIGRGTSFIVTIPLFCRI